MEISSIVNNWYSSVKKVFFKYRDGFFEMPILSNSPQATISSISKMPFVKFKPDEGYYGTNNPFMKADVWYHEIEEGLWVTLAKAEYKENVHYVRMKEDNLPAEYYKLFLEITRTEGESKKGMLDGMVYSNCSWVMLKTQEGNTHCRFKGNKTVSIVLTMHEEWVQKNMLNNDQFDRNLLNNFLSSKENLIVWSENIENAEIIERLSESTFNKKADKSIIENDWQFFVSNFIDAFVDRYCEDGIHENLHHLSQIDRKKIIAAEQYLIDHIDSKFTGIDNLAKVVGLSPTKLKSDFKLVYGETIFRYFRRLQLESARNALQNNSSSIKAVAESFGYSSQSKFSMAYKEEFGVLPSEDKMIRY